MPSPPWRATTPKDSTQHRYSGGPKLRSDALVSGVKGAQGWYPKGISHRRYRPPEIDALWNKGRGVAEGPGKPRSSRSSRARTPNMRCQRIYNRGRRRRPPPNLARYDGVAPNGHPRAGA